ncbi:hypothetical protein J1N35_011397, partial [Gossypium stocksii]
MEYLVPFGNIGTQWTVSSQECHTIERASLKPIEKNVGSLNFPSLITTLCKTTQVPLNANEDVKLNKGGMSRAIFAKIQGVEKSKQPQHSK